VEKTGGRSGHYLREVTAFRHKDSQWRFSKILAASNVWASLFPLRVMSDNTHLCFYPFFQWLCHMRLLICSILPPPDSEAGPLHRVLYWHCYFRALRARGYWQWRVAGWSGLFSLPVDESIKHLCRAAGGGGVTAC
jgi:hypothetical protein